MNGRVRRSAEEGSEGSEKGLKKKRKGQGEAETEGLVKSVRKRKRE